MIKVTLFDTTERIYVIDDIKRFDELGANVVLTFKDLTTVTLVYTTLVELQEAIGGPF